MRHNRILGFFRLPPIVILALLIFGCSSPAVKPAQLTPPGDAGVKTVMPTLSQPTPTLKPSPPYQLTFIKRQEGGRAELYAIDIMCIEGNEGCYGKPRLLFEAPSMLSLMWSPDGEHITYSGTNGKPGKGEIFYADSAGQNLIYVTNTPSISDGDPLWSEDGKSIIYTAISFETGTHFYEYNLASSTRTLLEVSENLGKMGLLSFVLRSWSKEKNILMLQGHGSEDFLEQIYRTNLDGTSFTRITKPGANYYIPALSPDGSQVAFIRENDRYDNDQTDLLIASIDGTGEKNLTNGSVKGVVSVAWAPFGDWIAFSSKNGAGDYDIYLIKTDGTNLMHIETGPSDDSNPAWRYIGK